MLFCSSSILFRQEKVMIAIVKCIVDVQRSLLFHFDLVHNYDRIDTLPLLHFIMKQSIIQQ